MNQKAYQFAKLYWLHFLAMSLFFITNIASAATADDYRKWIEDVHQRLDTTLELYQDGKISEAKSKVQFAYFEVFENLEGPIRINYSLQKSIELEATFGEIRKMITQKKSVDEVANKINWLQDEIAKVEAVLVDGHQLVGESADDVYDNEAINPYWQASFKIIDNYFEQAVSAFEKNAKAEAKIYIQKAQFEGYKNTRLEQIVRTTISVTEDRNINSDFGKLMKSVDAENTTLARFGSDISELLYDIQDLLPGLSVPEEIAEQQLAEKQAQEETEIANKDWARVARNINSSIQDAIELYQDENIDDAMMSVQDTYFDIFEGSDMESKVGGRNLGLKTTIEGHFTKIVALMKAKQPIEVVQQEAKNLTANLDQAVDILSEGSQTVWSLVLYGFMIIFREGMEALLIIAAIVAYLVKNDHKDKLPLIRQSVYAALAASVVTAIIFQLVFSNSKANQEILEGVTMLIAVVMLFGMSYWLLSKVEEQNWKLYLEGKLSKSLSTGSIIGLWSTSFLAVYREGAETILFYYAALGDVTSEIGYISLAGGFLIGCIALAIVYFVMRYTVVKIPLKPFFIITSIFMYIMAFIFAGKGMAELIEGKVFNPTLILGVPEMPGLGIYPYVETLLPQLILVVLAILAIFILFRISRQTS